MLLSNDGKTCLNQSKLRDVVSCQLMLEVVREKFKLIIKRLRLTPFTLVVATRFF